MNKVIGFFACMLIATSVAYGESIRVGNTGRGTVIDADGIERGDSEARYIARDERFASTFIGAGAMIGVPVYGDRDLYGTGLGLGWTLDAGVSFRKPKHIYHPGLKFSYQQIFDSGTFYYTDIDVDITHNIYSLAFDNQIKLGDDSQNIFGIRNIRNYLMFDIGVAGIDTQYRAKRLNLSESDRGLGAMLSLGYATIFQNGLGITFDTKYYFPCNRITDLIITLELGLRYTF